MTSATLAEKEAVVVFDFEFNCGIVFGINFDDIYMVEEEGDPLKDEPDTALYIHLGIITLMFMY